MNGKLRWITEYDGSTKAAVLSGGSSVTFKTAREIMDRIWTVNDQEADE